MENSLGEMWEKHEIQPPISNFFNLILEEWAVNNGVCWEKDKERNHFQDLGIPEEMPSGLLKTSTQQSFPFTGNNKVSTLFLQRELSLSTQVKTSVSSLHLSSLVVLTSSATLLMELMKVLRSELWTSQRTKYSSSAVPSRGFRLSLVSRWWILASNVFWDMERKGKTQKQNKQANQKTNH